MFNSRMSSWVEDIHTPFYLSCVYLSWLLADQLVDSMYPCEWEGVGRGMGGEKERS